MLAIGTPLLVIGEADWTHAVGVITLCAFVVLAFCAIDPGASKEGDAVP